MTSTQFREALAKLAMTQAELAKRLDISIRSAHGYANGAVIPRVVAMALELLLLRLRGKRHTGQGRRVIDDSRPQARLKIAN